jgi:membrane-associated phospholipid phosphatase
MSRVYVGVHFMSDVLAGWCMGGALLTLFITIRETIENKLIDRKAKKAADTKAEE